MYYAPPLITITNTRQKIEFYKNFLDLLKRELLATERLVILYKKDIDDKQDINKIENTKPIEKLLKVIELEKRLVKLQNEILSKMDYVQKYKSKLGRDEAEYDQIKKDCDRMLDSYLKDAKKILANDKYQNTKLLEGIVNNFIRIEEKDDPEEREKYKVYGFKMLRKEVDGIKYKSNGKK